MPSMVAMSLSVDICGGFVRFRNHFNGMARALFVADRAAGAFLEIEAIALSRTEFDDGFVGPCTKASVALAAVAATPTACGF